MERQGWRDEIISNWHRTRLGKKDYAVDLDFVLVEYTNYALPAALIEYKHEASGPVDTEHSNYQVLTRLADSANIPALVVIYENTFKRWELIPLNIVAKKAIWRLRNGQLVSDESAYIEFLTKLRKRVLKQFRSRSI